MKRIVPWMTWSAVIAIWSVAWIWGVFGYLHAANERLRTEYGELKNLETRTLGMLAAAPELLAQTDSVSMKYQEVLADFTRGDNLQHLPDDLVDSGRLRGIPEIEVNLDLPSVLALAVAPAPGSRVLDTVLVQISAEGEFGLVGQWLDEVEQRADFLQWHACRWEPGERDGMTRFSGTARFRIIAASAEYRAAEE